MLIERARLLLTTFWVGSLWAIGCLAAPTLFASLYDRVLAGTAAGSLFRTEAWVSVCCAIILLALSAWQERGQQQAAKGRRTGVRLILAMLACTVIGYFCLQPYMAALREAAGPAGVAAVPAIARQFAVLHGASMVFYLAGSVLGAVLVVKQAGR